MRRQILEKMLALLGYQRKDDLIVEEEYYECEVTKDGWVSPRERARPVNATRSEMGTASRHSGHANSNGGGLQR